MISLRLSEPEYEALRKIYRNYGARNVSDFARLAMQRVLGGSPDLDLNIALKVHELDDRLLSLEARVARIFQGAKCAS